MEMMNRAIEDARDYTEFQRELIESGRDRVAVRNRWGDKVSPAAQKLMGSPRRPGENREQHRARLFTKNISN